MKPTKAALLALAAFATAIAASFDEPERPEPDEPTPPQPDTGRPRAMVAGDPADPAIAAHLASIDAMLAAAGFASPPARTLLVMRKAPGEPVAIPPPDLWPNILPTLVLRRELGLEQLGIKSAYRPVDYNAAVGGSSNSAHIYFRALDLALTAADREPALEALLAAYAGGRAMGLGVYGFPVANRVHIDTGHGRRYWADTGAHLAARRA